MKLGKIKKLVGIAAFSCSLVHGSSISYALSGIGPVFTLITTDFLPILDTSRIDWAYSTSQLDYCSSSYCAGASLLLPRNYNGAYITVSTQSTNRVEGTILANEAYFPGVDLAHLGSWTSQTGTTLTISQVEEARPFALITETPEPAAYFTIPLALTLLVWFSKKRTKSLS